MEFVYILVVLIVLYVVYKTYKGGQAGFAIGIVEDSGIFKLHGLSIEDFSYNAVGQPNDSIVVFGMTSDASGSMVGLVFKVNVGQRKVVEWEEVSSNSVILASKIKPVPDNLYSRILSINLGEQP